MPRNDEAAWAELMQRSQAGDATAYERLLRELARAISGYLRHRFGELDFAEDCVQDCLIAIHEGRHTFVAGRPFRPWLFAIVRNRTIDLLRRQRADSGVFARGVNAADLAEMTPAAPPTDLHETVAHGSVLAALQPRHREALFLTKLMGYSIAEAAGHLGISEAAMKVRVHRATRAAIRMLETEPE
jgi:RNA polymerase sigma-70 factor (ECF subfamily)